MCIFNPNSHHMYVLIFFESLVVVFVFLLACKMALSNRSWKMGFPNFCLISIHLCFLGDVPKKGILNHPSVLNSDGAPSSDMSPIRGAGREISVALTVGN